MPKPHNFRGVLLDWDGTLLDSFHADSAAYLEMFRGLGIDWGLQELARHYSPNWHHVYRAAKLPRTRWEEADRLWRRAYRRHQPELLPGARRVLALIRRRYVLGLVTSGSGNRVRRQLRRLHLVRLFAVCVCSEDARHRKPHPAPLLRALARLRLSPEACVYVGDAPEDVEMARRAGMRVIGVLGPFPTARRLRQARPDALLRSIRELPGLLARWGSLPSR
jgi:HAD superfamily hydrolase (TIGR01509 family)